MNIELDIDDVLRQHVEEQSKQSKMFRDSPLVIGERMALLLDIAWDYDEAAKIILDLVDAFEIDHPGYLDSEREARERREQDEKDMPGGFFN